jgi:hypothetical protein
VQLTKLFHKACAARECRRARNTLQAFCEERVAARRALDEANRRADRALRAAAELEREQFRVEFFGPHNPVRSAYMVGSKAIFAEAAMFMEPGALK